MNYLNFDLLIYRSEHGYTARVTGSPIESKGSAEFELPADPIPTPEASPEAFQHYGAALFTAVFAGDVRQSLLFNFQAALAQTCGLRLRLCLDKGVPELALIPWELLYSPDWNRFIAYSVLTPLVRYIEDVQGVPPLKIEPPLRILVVISNPQDQYVLDALAEWQRLNETLAGLVAAKHVILEKLEEATLATLQKRLFKKDIHILHYIGHGYFDAKANQGKGEGGLYLENAARQSVPVSATELAVHLHDCNTLRLVFLNTCEGATSAYADYFAGTAQRLIQQKIPAVVAMQFPITDSAAICLSECFYQALATGQPLDSALSEARKAAGTQTANGLRFEWATPALFSRAPDNQLFPLPTVITPAQELPIALQELLDLLSSLHMSDETFLTLYRQSLPLQTQPRAHANLRSILSDLWNLPEPINTNSPLFAFVKAVSAQAPAGAQHAALEDWRKRQPAAAPNIPLPAAPVHPQSLYDPCLQIELCPSRQNGPGAAPKKYLLHIALHHNGKEQIWYAEQQLYTLDEVPSILSQVLTDNYLPPEAIFELIAPIQLFNENFDGWIINEMTRESCGELYPVIIRSLDRLNQAVTFRAKSLEKLQAKWAAFQKIMDECADNKLLWLDPTSDYKMLGSHLEKDAVDGLVGFNFAPENFDTFIALIKGGIPVALWPKHGSLENTVKETLKTNHLARQTPAKLPRWLQEVRAQALDVGVPFALLWDDPTRIPEKYRIEGAFT